MSIKLTWSPLGSQADSLAVYWSDAEFTALSLPANKVDIPVDSLTYTDESVPVAGIRYYMIEAKKAGLPDLYSQCLCYGNFLKTGPGRTTPLRGDWNIGYMGPITAANFFTVAGLKTALGLSTSFAGVPSPVLGSWHKFAFKGKIIFIPDAIFSAPGTARWSDFYNNGLVYGVDGPGEAPMLLTTAGRFQPPVPVLVNQKRVVTLGEDSFLVRFPKLSDKPTNEFVDTTHNSYVNGEWWNTMCRMVFNDRMELADIPRMSTSKFGDLSLATNNFLVAGTQHFFAGTSSIAISSENFSGHIARDTQAAVGAGAIHWVPVLEYIPS